MASLADLPSCAIACLATAIANSTCAPTDRACTCTNAAITSQTTLCMRGSCTMVEMLATLNVTNSLCGREPANDRSWIAPAIVLLCTMVIVVCMRFLARAIADMPFWWDDWMNFAAMAFCIAIHVAGFEGLAHRGYGKDVWIIPAEDITEFLKIYYIATGMYVGARCCTRVSIISFYLRIFSVKAHRKIIYTLIVEVTISVTFIITIMFQCTPISFYWTKWDLQHTGKCINTYLFMVIGWGLLIAADFWVMWLPLPTVASLQLSLRKKLLISIMFATGIAVTAVGIAKLPMVYGATHTTNPTHDLVEMGKYCLIEVELGVICSCMPSLPVLFRPLVRKVTGKHKGPDSKGTTGTGYVGSSLRRAAMGDNKPSTTTSSAGSYPLPSSPHAHQAAYYEHVDYPTTEQIQAVTTID